MEDGKIVYMMDKTDSYWKGKLTPQQYSVLREKATDIPYSNIYFDNKEDGLYKCAGCGQILFTSKEKYDSGCGWPSFYDIQKKGVVSFHDDFSHNMQRTEVTCSTCGGHLGHLFEDPSTKTGNWYCINSSSLNFEKKE